MDQHSVVSKLLSQCHFVRQGQSGGSEWFSVYDPAVKGQKICDVADQEVALEDIQQISLAQQHWAALGFDKRAEILVRWAELCGEKINELAQLLTLEQGKPLMEARGELGASIKNISWAADQAQLLDKSPYDYQEDSHVQGAKTLVNYDPLGIVAAITPWNFPSAMVTRKVAPALAAGCAAILKPAEDTPLSALALAELAYQAGIPRDVFKVVTVSREKAAGFSAQMFSNPRIAMLSFTGSTEIGRILIRQSAENITKLSLELGGNAPFIIRQDADIDKSVAAIFASRFRNAGQTCICANRIYVHADIYDDVMRRLSETISHVKIGNGFDEDVHIGPVINERAYQRLYAEAQDLISEGAKLLAGTLPKPDANSLLMAPMLFACELDSQVARRELFGPIACLFKYDDDQQVISLANDTEYGLAAYIYSGDHGQAEFMAKALQFGMVGINEVAIADASIPFGGVKCSGYGREGGRDCLKPYFAPQYLCLKGA